MKCFHSLIITAFVKNSLEEDILFDEFIKNASIDIEETPVEVEIPEMLEGFSTNLKILRITVLKKVEHIMKYILSNTTDTWIDTLDEDNTIYIRFEKEAFSEGVLKPTRSGNCVHMKAKIAAYPAKKEVAFETYKRFIDESCKS